MFGETSNSECYFVTRQNVSSFKYAMIRMQGMQCTRSMSVMYIRKMHWKEMQWEKIYSPARQQPQIPEGKWSHFENVVNYLYSCQIYSFKWVHMKSIWYQSTWLQFLNLKCYINLLLLIGKCWRWWHWNQLSCTITDISWMSTLSEKPVISWIE